MKRSLILLSLMVFAACKKDKAQKDEELPVINMTSPTNGQSFANGQTVNITGNISDNVKIEEVHLEILNTGTNILFTHEHFAPDAATYTLSRSFTLPSSGNYKITVEADDNSGNSAKSEISIRMN